MGVLCIVAGLRGARGASPGLVDAIDVLRFERLLCGRQPRQFTRLGGSRKREYDPRRASGFGCS